MTPRLSNRTSLSCAAAAFGPPARRSN